MSRSPSTSQRGGALIITLWVAFGLVSLALYFGNAMSLELKSAENRSASMEAGQVCEGAARYAAYLFNHPDTAGQLPAVSSYSREAVSVGDGVFWFLGREDAASTPTLPYYSLSDESGKLNLNTATQGMLELLPRMTPSLAAAILDWRDADQDVTAGGAEDETYARQTPPYRAKNGPFESLEELRLVFGMTREILYGEDVNQNGILDPNENDGDISPPPDNRDGKLDPGILEYLTIQTPSVTSNGTTLSLVNANTASEVVLTCLPGIGKDNAAALVSYRRAHVDELSSPDWFSKAFDGASTSGATSYLTNSSSFFVADIAALGQHARGYRRERFIFDVSTGTARIAARQDLTSLGWALGREARQTALLMKGN